jgi:chloramphenicol O-acetyltransferase type A
MRKKYVNNNGKFEMPVTIQINHDVADGYHTSMLFKEIQDTCLSLL